MVETRNANELNGGWNVGWTVLCSSKENTRKTVKIRNYMIYWGKRDECVGDD